MQQFADESLNDEKDENNRKEEKDKM